MTGHLQLQHQQRQRNGDDTVGQREQALDARDVLVVVLCRHPQELRRWRTAERVIASGARQEHPRMFERCHGTIVVMQLLAIASHPGSDQVSRRAEGGAPRVRVLPHACGRSVPALCSVRRPAGRRQRGGTSPRRTGTGGDDVLLGSSCATSVQCMAVGITLNNLNSNGDGHAARRGLERLELDAGCAAAPAGRRRRRPLRRQLRQRI